MFWRSDISIHMVLFDHIYLNALSIVSYIAVMGTPEKIDWRNRVKEKNRMLQRQLETNRLQWFSDTKQMKTDCPKWKQNWNHWERNLWEAKVNCHIVSHCANNSKVIPVWPDKFHKKLQWYKSSFNFTTCIISSLY